jgi:hypothetical protein
VFYPLEPLRFPDILWPPPEPEPPRSTDEDYYVNEFTIGGGRGGADVCVSILSRSSWQHQRTAVDVYERGGGGAWRNLASMELELPWSAASHLPFIDGRLYLVASASAVAAMRLASCIPADVPTIALPEGLESRYDGSYEIAKWPKYDRNLAKKRDSYRQRRISAADFLLTKRESHLWCRFANGLLFPIRIDSTCNIVMSPPPATAASGVLDNDDLLGEILRRRGRVREHTLALELAVPANRRGRPRARRRPRLAQTGFHGIPRPLTFRSSTAGSTS